MGRSMGPIHVSIDPALIEGLLVGTIGIVAATVGAIAAVAVSREARTKRRSLVTAHGLPPVLANRLAMTIGGSARICDPLNLHFFLTDPAVTLLQIELANPLDKGAKN